MGLYKKSKNNTIIVTVYFLQNLPKLEGAILFIYIGYFCRKHIVILSAFK